MKIVSRTYWLPKKGNTIEEYEDAACPLQTVDSDVKEFLCAVADGATETSFARLWAQLLVEGFVSGTELSVLKQRWARGISRENLPWYAEEKAELGAYAALVGLTLNESAPGKGAWSATAIGDCCVLQVRKSSLIERFPIESASEFGIRPVLLSSNAGKDKEEDDAWLKKEGRFLSGDSFYLLSDAIACFMLSREEKSGDAALFLESIDSQESLEAFAEVQREVEDDQGRPLMRNDDVTLMRVSVEL